MNTIQLNVKDPTTEHIITEMALDGTEPYAIHFAPHPAGRWTWHVTKGKEPVAIDTKPTDYWRAGQLAEKAIANHRRRTSQVHKT